MLTRRARLALLGASFIFDAIVGICPTSAQEMRVFAPLPPAPEVKAPLAELGRALFFDTRLSGDTGNACSTCHDPAQGWGDGKTMSSGYTGVEYFRNAPSLFNVAGRNYLMWDGRLDGMDLPTAVRDMITEAHTMNMDTRLLQERLKQVPGYMALFERAFGPGTEPYGGRIYGAIAEYLKTIRTENAPFDRWLNGESTALTDEQKAGMVLFQGKANCAVCHNGPMLSDGAWHVTGVPENPAIAEDALRQIAMLRHFATMGVPDYMNLRRDVGRYVVTKEEADIGSFVTPSLWDIGQTAPYMHNGFFAALDEVVAFYDRGGGEVANRDEALRPLGLSEAEKAALVAFLKSLSGEVPQVEPPEIGDYGLRDLGVN